MWRSTADSHPAYCPPRPLGLILQNCFLGCELSACILLPGSISGTTDAVQVGIDTLLSYLTLLYVWPKGYHLATHVLGFQFSGSPDPCQNWTSFLRGPWEEVRMPGRIVLLATSVHYHHLITCLHGESEARVMLWWLSTQQKCQVLTWQLGDSGQHIYWNWICEDSAWICLRLMQQSAIDHISDKNIDTEVCLCIATSYITSQSTQLGAFMPQLR